MIPKIIHQSWKVEEVPIRWLAFQESWRANHPTYDYRFWTDAANRAFVAHVFPEFLSAYDGYRHPVSRADLARYLIVCHYGGVYADLDCQCLKPLDELLSGHELVFGLEPASHVQKLDVAKLGLDRIVCNAVFASAPGHPFWRHLFPMLLAAGEEGNVLEAAGPFMLTRACNSYPRPQEITILPSELLYPIDRFLQPNRKAGAGASVEGYCVHHWAGTWWRQTVLDDARRRIAARERT